MTLGFALVLVGSFAHSPVSGAADNVPVPVEQLDSGGATTTIVPVETSTTVPETTVPETSTTVPATTTTAKVTTTTAPATTTTAPATTTTAPATTTTAPATTTTAPATTTTAPATTTTAPATTTTVPATTTTAPATTTTRVLVAGVNRVNRAAPMLAVTGSNANLPLVGVGVSMFMVGLILLELRAPHRAQRRR